MFTHAQYNKVETINPEASIFFKILLEPMGHRITVCIVLSHPVNCFEMPGSIENLVFLVNDMAT